MTKQKLVIVSNRLPVSVSKDDGKLIFKPSSGGLPTAMSSLKRDDIEMKWIGWPGIDADSLTESEKRVISIKLKKDYGCYPVFLTKEQVENFYYGYANDTLWPLFHYFQSYAQYDDRYWQSYLDVNNTFRKVIKKHADNNSKIWIHDYHLMLLPQQLRELYPDSTIGFFLHIPFPSFEIFRLLPDRTQVLEGLLGSDLIGFHTFDYARHFLSSSLRVLGLPYRHGTITVGDRVVKVDAFPIGIDYKKFANAATKDKDVQDELAILDELYEGKKVIISMDRLDYSKGITKRLEAYEVFLENNPTWRKKVVMAVVAVPSRTEVETYQKLREEIERSVSRINGAYGTPDWTPISYQFRNLPFEKIVAFLARADIALLTPLRDGMNLVAKEFIAAKQKRNGVLILSEMTGAVDELPEATVINPNNINAIVKSLKSSLKMPKKTQREKLNSMQNRLSQYTVQRWANDFLEQMDKSKQNHLIDKSKLLTKEKRDKIVRQYKNAGKRLIIADYDGTLRGYVASPSPHKSAPPKTLRHLMNTLANQDNTELSIVSGRPKSVLENWFQGMPLSLAAEHGAWIKVGSQWAQQDVSMHEYKQPVLELFEQYRDRTPGAYIEEKDFAVVWHYRNVPVELAHARNASLMYELHGLLSGSDISIHKGNKIIEVKPSITNKGIVAEELVAIHKPDFIMALGDDYTDEDMFDKLPDDATTIKVGIGDTKARYQVISIEKIRELLKLLSESK